MRSRYRWQILVGILPLLLLTTPFVVDWVAHELRRAAQFRASARSLEEAIAEADRHDPYWRWDALQASLPGVPDEENLYLKIPAVKALCNGLGRRPSGNGHLFDNFEAPVSPNQLYDVEETAELMAHQSNHAAAVALARNLEKYPRARIRMPMGNDPLSFSMGHQTDIREVASLMKYEVEKLAIENRPGEAIHFIRGMINCSEAMGDDPVLISHLVKNAGRSVATGAVERLLGLTEPGPELASLLEPLRRAAAARSLRMGFRGERAYSNGQFALLDTQPDGARLAMVDDLARQDRLSPREYRPFFDEDRAASLRAFRLLIDSFDLPLHEQRKFADALIKQFRRRETPLTSSLLPVTVKVIASDQRTVASLECARIAVACELYRRKHQAWPKSLEDIPKQWLPEIPLDPYDGKPLRYRILPESIRVYTVGEDGLDDADRIVDELHPPVTYYRIEVWNPEKRRLPGPPPRPEELGFPMELPDANEVPKE
jgi:hypothetical protein